ncbi:MAG TPA: ABC transporter substrate-binding protein [Stellaceae bacterium]|jgi:iron complex transport system substrate-binding protein|nr:ABC transporter substrate-binding protein [Stellaceae bacterium]
MPFRSLALRVAGVLALLLAAASAPAAEFTDSAGRRVMLPDQIARIMPAGPASAVFVYVLVPDKLVGWPLPLSRAQRALVVRKYARLPVVGQLGGPYPTATADEVIALHPDLIVGYGRISPPTVALADRIQQQTHTPYILLDDSIQLMPQVVRELTPILGAGDRGLAVSSYAFHAIGALRGQLLITSPTDRPLVYYGRGPDGLEAALPGSVEASVIEQAGVINVAGGLGRDGVARVTPEQVFAWNPQIVIAQQRSFYNALQRSPRWRGLAAVRNKKVYLAPADPFGWIDDPPGLNRAIGMYWLSSLFYPDLYQQDLATVAREFYQLYYQVQLTDRQVDALVRPALGNTGQSRQLANVPILGAEPPPMPGASPGNEPQTPPTGVPGRGRLRGGGQAPQTPGAPGSP